MRKTPAAVNSPKLAASIFDNAFALEPKFVLGLLTGLLLVAGVGNVVVAGPGLEDVKGVTVFSEASSTFIDKDAAAIPLGPSVVAVGA